MLWSTVGETALAKVFFLCVCVCANKGLGSIRVCAEEGSCLEWVYTVRKSEKQATRVREVVTDS